MSFDYTNNAGQINHRDEMKTPQTLRLQWNINSAKKVLSLSSVIRRKIIKKNPEKSGEPIVIVE